MIALKTRPPYGALTAEPMTLEELDNHAEKDKIWALVIQVRTMAYEEGYDDGWHHGVVSGADPR